MNNPVLYLQVNFIDKLFHKVYDLTVMYVDFGKDEITNAVLIIVQPLKSYYYYNLFKKIVEIYSQLPADLNLF